MTIDDVISLINLLIINQLNNQKIIFQTTLFIYVGQTFYKLNFPNMNMNWISNTQDTHLV
jgi:hypothetical protein